MGSGELETNLSDFIDSLEQDYGSPFSTGYRLKLSGFIAQLCSRFGAGDQARKTLSRPLILKYRLTIDKYSHA